MTDHIHRHVVEPPCGKAELPGVCRCGDVRTYPAVMPEGGWQRTGGKALKFKDEAKQGGA